MKTRLLSRFFAFLTSSLIFALASGCDKTENLGNATSTPPGELVAASTGLTKKPTETATLATGSAALPPLNPRIVEMMKTNTAGIIEARIHFVESWEVSGTEKAQVYFSMLAASDDEDQRKLAHAATRQAGAQNYSLVRDHLLDPRLPRPVLSVFLTDTLKRQNSLKIPMLLHLAQADGHPMQTEAKDLLTVYFGQNHGTNWTQWEESMLAYIEKNPN